MTITFSRTAQRTAGALAAVTAAVLMTAAPAQADWRPLGDVRHGFTHFALTLDIMAAALPQAPETPDGAVWTPLSAVLDAGLPSVMAKIARLALTRETLT